MMLKSYKCVENYFFSQPKKGQPQPQETIITLRKSYISGGTYMRTKNCFAEAQKE